MKNKSALVLPLLVATVLVGTATSAITLANAASTSSTNGQPAGMGPMVRGMHAGGQNMPAFAAAGKVTALSGSTITILDVKTNTTYTVDASKASVLKDRGATASLSDIAVNDMIAVEGTVSGSSIAATVIHDGFGGPGMMGGRGGGVAGSVAAINGNVLTVTSKDGGTYTIDASSASVRANGTDSSVANIKVGDTVMVRGTIKTASMTASAIEDGIPTRPAARTATATQ